ncbi:hypothetical protein Scep_022060 [Stephania cephalantha]|uniref:Uncharacterized protein n=1 Tax=Stephania cephalantha TaxID=152367 RepID=A0AAP0F4M3_9MAGN
MGNELGKDFSLGDSPSPRGLDEDGDGDESLSPHGDRGVNGAGNPHGERGFPATGTGMGNLNRYGDGDGENIGFPHGDGDGDGDEDENIPTKILVENPRGDSPRG